MAFGPYSYAVATDDDDYVNAVVDGEDRRLKLSVLSGAESFETTAINAQTGTSYTLALTDRGQTVTMSNASANTVTIPTNAAVAFDVGTVIAVVMLGAGTTSITGDTGVTLNGVSAGSGGITAQYQGATLLKIGTDTWVLSGNTGTVS